MLDMTEEECAEIALDWLRDQYKHILFSHLRRVGVKDAYMEWARNR